MPTDNDAIFSATGANAVTSLPDSTDESDYAVGEVRWFRDTTHHDPDLPPDGTELQASTLNAITGNLRGIVNYAVTIGTPIERRNSNMDMLTDAVRGIVQTEALEQLSGDAGITVDAGLVRIGWHTMDTLTSVSPVTSRLLVHNGSDPVQISPYNLVSQIIQSGYGVSLTKNPANGTISINANISSFVPANRRVNTSGLATGGGDLSVDRTVTVPAATAPDMDVGVGSTQAVTPAMTRYALDQRVGPLETRTTALEGQFSTLDASDVDFIPSGSIAATDVQGAVEELDAEKLSTSHEGSGGAAHAAATTSVAGFMSAADKTKLDGVATGATAFSSAYIGTTSLAFNRASGAQTLAGVSIDGNAATATTATTASTLATARNIAGVSFNGSADIAIPFANLSSKPTTLIGYGITDAMPLAGGTFTGPVTLAGPPSADLHAATKKYVDDLVAGGVVPASSISFSPAGNVSSTNMQAAIEELDSEKLATSHAGTGGTAHAAATTSVAGFMSAADKTKLDGVATGATAFSSAFIGTTSLAFNRASGAQTLSGVSIDGNAATATTLATARTIAGVSFNGSANIAIPFANLSSLPTTLAGYGITNAMPLSGGTFTGLVTLSADPTSALHAATKQYVDAAAGGANDYQLFTSSGTWTKPAGLTGNEIVMVELWGGGGGGRQNGTDWNASGGGGGEYRMFCFRAAELSATESVTVGAGGTAGASGTAGGFSSFNGIVAAGGNGGGSAGTVSQRGWGGFTPGGAAYYAADVSSPYTTPGYVTTLAGNTTLSASAFGLHTIAAGGEAGGAGGWDDGATGNYTPIGAINAGGGGGIAATFGRTGGTSVRGGAGGTSTGTTGAAGTAPAGGGAGGTSTAGNGARGEVRVTVLR
jgi:hypothetical protein